MPGMKRAMRQFTFGSGKTAGRNSSGRITSFHRGGGAKRSQRTVDLKRNTSSSVGVVERIEYDPNRSSRIALVRWLNGIRQPRPQPKPRPIFNSTSSYRSFPRFDPSSTADGGDNIVRGVFPLNSMLPSTSTNVANILHCYAASRAPFWYPVKYGKDKHGLKNLSMSLGVPRIAVAAARPDFFGKRDQWEVKYGHTTLHVRNWKKNSDMWANRNKRKAALPWHSKARFGTRLGHTTIECFHTLLSCR